MMKVFVKESLYVLDYEDNIIDCIFNSDDHRTPGYAYNISITDNNTGYSDLTFTMPTKVIKMPSNLEDNKEAQENIDNPKLKLLTPLSKIRYERQIIYTGETPITVSVPMSYGDETVYKEVVYNPGDLIEYDADGNKGVFIMDYIIQPEDKKRSGLEVSITFTAIDYPRFNLSKKKLGLTINENTITRGDWSIYEKEPMNVPGAIQYVKWTPELTEDIFGRGAVVPLNWDPSTMTGYPLTDEQIETLLRRTDVWTYGITATIFYWPISQSGRFEGVLYNRDDYLTLNLYEKNLVEVLEEGAALIDNKNYVIVKYTWAANPKDATETRYVKSVSLNETEAYICEQNLIGTDQYLGSIEYGATPPIATEIGDWYAVKTPAGSSLDFYGHSWGYYDQGRAYLTPNNPCNYLQWILENTNWKIKERKDKQYKGVYFNTEDFPETGEENDYLLYKTVKENEIQMEGDRPVYRGVFSSVSEIPDGNNTDNWAVVSDGYISNIYRWDGEKWYLSRDGISKLKTEVYIWNETEWEKTENMWTASIDKETGVLYDVDQVEKEIAKPDGAVGDLFEDTQLRTTLTASDSNCYNGITELSKSFQLYPVFDCVNREIALHLFCGKNYGLTYQLGKSLENTTVKKDGEKVITKLRCYGGTDAQGNENINLGDANRQYEQTFTGYYTTNELPTSDFGGFVAVVDPDLNEDEPWISGPNRQIWFFEGNGWVLGTDNGDGTWTHNNYIIDAQSGAFAPWNPNDDMYIQARSPYGTEYVYNFKWMYDNGWMSKEDILGLYKKSLEIQELNKGFLDNYLKDYKYANEMSVKAGVDYKTNQDEYLACLSSMMDTYYKDPVSPSEGQFTAFFQAPADSRKGIDGFNNENPNYYYVDMYHCYQCGYTSHEEFPEEIDEEEHTYLVCPNCNSKIDSKHLSVRLPVFSDFAEDTHAVIDNPKTKGFYREVLNDIAEEDWKYVKVTEEIPHKTFDVTYNQQVFLLNTKAIPTLKKVYASQIENVRVDADIFLPQFPDFDSYIFTYNNENWWYNDSVVILDSYGITVEGTPADGDQITITVTNEAYDKSSHMYNWNDYVAKWQEYYGLQLDNLSTMNKYIKICDKLDEEYNIYQKQLNELENYIQDNWGDYIVEGKYKDSTICYTNILLSKSLDASEEYCIPKITYTASVVDSSGLIEYRGPLADTYNDLVKSLHNSGQIVPHAGDYVKIIDKQLGLYGTPAVITSIKRNLDNPQSNSITVDTSYTDDEEFVGNIITATNTVLNNQDIYARTAILKGDGTIEGASLNKTLEQNNGENLAFIGTKGSSLLDSTGLVVTNQGNVNRKMRYAGNGIFGTSDNGVTWQSMMTPEGINANYINAGSIDTKHIQIMSGQKAKIILDNLGLTVKNEPDLPYKLPDFNNPALLDEDGFPDWSKSNIKSFIGVDNSNDAHLYLNGQMNIEGGSKIAGWKVLTNKLYSGNDNNYVSLSTDPDNDYSIWAGSKNPINAPFSIKKTGELKSTFGVIANWHIGADTLEGKNNTTTYITLRSNLPEDTTHAIDVNNGVFYVQRNGKMFASNADIEGNINAKTGTIGGWTIEADKLSGSGTISGGTISGSSISGGNINIGSNFSVTNQGVLTAKSAKFSGTITSSTISLSGNGKFEITHTPARVYLDSDLLHFEYANHDTAYIGVPNGFNTGMLYLDGIGNGYGALTIIGDHISSSHGSVVFDDTYINAGSIGIGEHYINSSAGGQIDMHGDINIHSNNGSVYIGGSDPRNKVLTVGGSPSTLNIKENVVKKDISNIPSILRNIDLYNYKYIKDIENGKEDWGYIIDYLEQVNGIKDYLTFFEGTINGHNVKQISTESLIKFLLACVVNQQKQIDTLKKENN